MKKLFTILALVLLVAFPGRHHPVAMPTTPNWDAFVNQFVESYFALHPAFAVRSGRHEFDGQMPDWSRAGLNKEIQWLKSQRQRALDFDSGSLEQNQRFERDYLTSVIDSRLFWLDIAKWPYKNPIFYSRALDPNVYVTRQYAPLIDRFRAYIAYVKAVPKATEQIRQNLQTPLPRTYIELSKIVFGGLAKYYEQDVASVFESVDDAELKAEFRSANTQAAKAMKKLVSWFQAQHAVATEEFAMGPELFSKMLWETERVNVPLDRLEKLGREDTQRNFAALRTACKLYAPGRSMEQCIAKIQGVKPEDGPVAGALRQLPNLKAFLVAKGLVTVPQAGEAQVADSPPYKRWNPAYIDIPGTFEKGLPSVYYVAPPDSSWSPEERQAYIPGQSNLLFISIHEVWPGHFLQHLHAHEAASTFGQLFVGYAFSEGWAHYTEELMWEAGLNKGNPETHIGQLFNALLRNVRYLCAIGLHTQAMNVEACVKMFREKAYQDSANARQQAARGTFDPAYINYTLGKLMIRKLRADWTRSRGQVKAWREFHDTFLSFGGPPIPLVRKAMLGANAGPPL